ncbi:MAG TPA: NAD(P)/FAD-dependent oxidoreductase [Fibrobacteria bacterium]|nr:NAD(P)/FAD-dependent oxidoreductase [Fibrobacteria bacterium]
MPASKSYDIVVIGAGPSGSLCARNLAAKGYQVLLAEKRPVVGVPVRCGEATGRRARLSRFMDVNEGYIETDLNGVILHGPGGVSIRYDKPDVGLMIDRALFDQDVARQAVRAGAELRVGTRVEGISPVKDGVRELTVVDEATRAATVITAKLVVGADGAEALSGRWVGLKTRQLPPQVCSAIELRVDAVDANPNHLTFWQGHESVNKGYVWVFPKVKSKVVNLGSGVLTPKLGEKNMYDLSMEYKNRLFPDAKVLKVHGGAVPVSGNLREYVADRFLLCGDAAHHTNPLTGGGIISGILGADIASIWIDAGLKAGDLSRAFLRQYEMECWEQFGKNHRHQMRIRDFVVDLPLPAQTAFYRIFRDMVKGDLSLPSKVVGYARMMGLAAGNWKVAKRAFFG